MEGSEETGGLTYKFRLKSYAVDAILTRNSGELVSTLEAYYSEKPLQANGEPPLSTVRGIMSVTAPTARWRKQQAVSPQLAAFVTEDGSYEAAILPPDKSVDPRATFTVVVTKLETASASSLRESLPSAMAQSRLRELPEKERAEPAWQQLPTCRYYNSFVATWSLRPILIDVDKDGGIHFALGRESYWARNGISMTTRLECIALLKKGLAWGEKAATERVELSKPLGDALNYGFWFTFFSANRGQQTDVILHMHDFRSWVSDNDAYMNPDQVRALIAYLDRLPAMYEEKRRSQAKKSEFR